MQIAAVTSGEKRTVIEFILYLKNKGKTIDLPVAVVADCNEGGASEIRVYYSTWPVSGKQSVRPPVLMPTIRSDEPEFVRKYMDGLGRPDIEKVLELFEADGYVQEALGEQYKYSGPESRKNYYKKALDSGGISLKHCTETFDGTRFVVEYVCDGYGKKVLPSQAGVAIFEQGMSGRLHAVRIYDDLSPSGKE